MDGEERREDPSRAPLGPALAVAQPARVLVTFATRHGSTADVAEAIGDELRAAGLAVDVRPVRVRPPAANYDAVVVGGPMIAGWHRAARRFLRRNRGPLSRVPIACFFTALSLTDTGSTEVEGVPFFLDPWLAKPPASAARLSRRERYATPANYLRPALDAAGEARPVSAAFFGGALDLTQLNVFEKLFVTLLVGATPGDTRNFAAVREWAAALPAALGL